MGPMVAQLPGRTFACLNSIVMTASHFLAPGLADGAACRITIDRNNTVLAEHLEIAATSRARRRGLLGRDQLPSGHGLAIAPCQAVHTWSMRFAIDVIALDRQGRVLKFWSGVTARRVRVCWSAFAIIELPAGAIVAAGLARGDRLSLTRTV